jgi:hypothetical protein
MGKTGFIVYSLEQRAKVKAEFPKLSFAQISKKIGRQWKALSPEERTAYQEKAKKQ